MSEPITANQSTNRGTPLADGGWAAPNYKWYVVGMLWFIAFFNYADRVALGVVMPRVRVELGLDDFQVALIGSAFAWIYGLGAPFAGLVIDRVRRKTAILFGLVTWSVVCMLTATSRSWRQLFGFMAAEGLGETFYFPASMSLVSDYHGKRTRSRAMSIHQTSVYGGTILGSVFAGLIADYLGWRYSFVIFGALGVVVAFILMFFLREPHRGAADEIDAGVPVAPPIRLSVGETLRVILQTPTVLTLFAAFICANFVFVVVMVWLPTLLAERLNLQSLAIVGLTATMYMQIASVFGAPASGWMADRLRQRTARGRMIVQAAGVLAAAPFIVVTGLSTSYIMVASALACWGFFKGVYDANIFASMYDVIRPEARGTAAGFMNAVGWIGGGGGPLVIAKIKTAFDVSLGEALAMGAVAYVLAGCFLLIGIAFFVKRDAARMQEAVKAAATGAH
ncbi:MAG: MFS transporter [Candidatus Hydrogenedentes bacterium]|nr:MFS transporter [Candidatus Hydrogenedentota bacterium]